MQVPLVGDVDEGMKTQTPSVPPALHDSLNIYSAHLALLIQVVPSETHPYKAVAHSLLLDFLISMQVFFLHELESLS